MSQITIEVVSVSPVSKVPTKQGKSYDVIEIAYKKDGKIEGKKIMSFVNPTVFKTVQNLTQGEVVSVTTEKNEAGYWQWTAISTGSALAVTTEKAPHQASFSKRNDEVQTMIVRQSSLGHAVSTLSVGAKTLKGADVIALAKEYEAFVMGKETEVPVTAAKPASLNEDFPDDIPL